jgi:phospholipid N-methyltransferase
MTHKPSLLQFLQERLVFLLHFLKNPLRNASVMPSSRAAARAMMTGVNWSGTNVIVELGPGTGTFTREVLRLCRPDARIILIELEPKYVKWLREKFGDRIEVIHGSAIDMNKHLAERGIDHADLILSSLPFLSDDISAPLHHDILKHTDRGGLFRFFTYMPPAMKPHYRDMPIRRVAFTEWNLPPMWIFGIN